MTWTMEEEVELRRLQNKKAHEEAITRGCVEQAVSQFHYRDMDSDQIVDALIENAATIRKVLEPFDNEEILK